MSKEKLTFKEPGIWEAISEKNGKVQKRYLVKVYRWTPDADVKKPGLKRWARNPEQARQIKKLLEAELDRKIANRSRHTFASFYETIHKAEIASTHAVISSYNISTAFDGKLLPFLGSKFLDEITTADINDFLHINLKELSVSTRKNYRKFLNSLFKSAISRRLITMNPVDQAKGIKGGGTRQETYLTPNQLTLLLDFVFKNKHEWRYHFALSALTGMRVNECRALRYCDINFETDLIHVRNTLDRRSGFKPYTKNFSQRTVPLTPDLREVLLERKRQEGLTDADFVVPQLRLWLSGEQGKVLHDLLVLLGLPKMRYYDFRATYAVAMALQGTPILKIAEILGHASIEMTSRYLRHLGVLLKGSADCLTGLISPTVINTLKKEEE